MVLSKYMKTFVFKRVYKQISKYICPSKSTNEYLNIFELRKYQYKLSLMVVLLEYLLSWWACGE